MRKILLLAVLTIGLFCSWQAVLAQKTITGKVTDHDGQSIPGATIVVKGTTNGTITDATGKFSIKAPSENATLIISFIGMVSKELPLMGKLTVNVTLEPSTQAIEEVVVSALNISRSKKSLGYATATIRGDDLVKSGDIQNPLTAMYGLAAGLGVEVSSSGPTGGVKINIRGNASLNGNANTRPLIVVDGIPIYDSNSSMAARNYNGLTSFDYGTGINDINGADIESIELLKGAKATVLYGSLAGNGVMMITTKKGKQTRGLGVTVSLQAGFDHPVNYIDWQNDHGTGTSIYDLAYANDPITGSSVRALNSNRFNFGPKFDNSKILNYDNTYTTYRAYPNNYNDIFRNTTNTEATVAISGASEKGNMRLSYTNKDYNGILQNFYQKNNDVSFNGRYKASDFASFEIVTNLYNVQTQNRLPNIGRLVSNGINRDADFKHFATFYKDNLGQQRNDYSADRFPYVFTGAGDGYFPMLWGQNENRNTDNKLHLVASAKVDLSFTKWLGLTIQAGTDYTDWEYVAKNKVTQIYPTVQGGAFSDAREIYKIQNYTALLNFNHKYFDNRLDIVAFAGPSYYQNDYSRLGVQTVGGLQFQDWYSLAASKSQSGQFGQAAGENRSTTILSSILGNASLAWKSTFYLEISARQDRTSTLAPGDNSYFYPGASLSYNFNQTFKIPELTYGKLRISAAAVGKGATQYAYWAYPSYNLGLVQGTGAITISSPSSLFAQNIKPEMKKEVEIGFDTQWFEKHPLEVNFSFYTATNYNQIIDLGLTASTGYADTKVNAGGFRNWGYEFFAKYTPVLTKIHKLDVSLTIANQYSKVTSLYPGINQYAISGSGAYTEVAIPGQKIGNIQAYDYLRDHTTGKKIVNANTGIYSPDNSHLVEVGNINPYLLGGFFVDYHFKNLGIHVGMNYKFGGTYLSYTNYYLYGQGLTKATLQYRDAAHGGMAYYINKSNHNMALPTGATSAPTDSQDGIVYHNGLILDGVKDDGSGHFVKNDLIISDYTYYSTYVHDMSEWFQPDKLSKNDYLKVREVSISYTLPQKIAQKLAVEKLMLSAFGRNLFYLYKTLPNIDPESSMGSNSFVEYTSLPQVRTLGFKLDASF